MIIAQEWTIAEGCDWGKWGYAAAVSPKGEVC
jgi:hypothetical protein